MEGEGGEKVLGVDVLGGHVDWGDLSVDFSEPIMVPPLTPPPLSSLIGEIETLLMKEDDDVFHTPDQQIYDDFLAEILVDSPPPPPSSSVDASSSADSHSAAASPSPCSQRQEKEAVDPDSKKRIRQLRNRDAALRSRERKKMYVKDLEMKSRYLEAECRRLGRLLQCFVAENQALRFSLHNGNATSTKQESAVLFLESLLLGSLLWSLGVVCLFSLPLLYHPNLEANALENAGEKVPREVAPSGAGSKTTLFPMVQSFVTSKRCKASRTRMKPGSSFLRVLV